MGIRVLNLICDYSLLIKGKKNKYIKLIDEV